MKIEKVCETLKKKYPKAWFRVEGDTIVSGEGCTTNEGVELFNYWSMDHETYEFGVLLELVDIVNELGYYWEARDPGTYILYEL